MFLIWINFFFFQHEWEQISNNNYNIENIHNQNMIPNQ